MAGFEDFVARYPGCAGYWPLDEATGTGATEMVAGRAGTYTGTVTLAQRALVPGGRASPTFGGGYVTVPTNAAFSPEAGASGKLSVLAVVYATALNAAQMIVTKSNPPTNNAQWQLRTGADGSVLFDLSTGLGSSAVHQTQTAAGAVALNTVAMILGAFDAAAHTSTLYVNGAQSSQATGALNGVVTAGNAPVEIGRRNDLGGSVWAGSIGFVAVFNTTLAQVDATLIRRAFLCNGASVG